MGWRGWPSDGRHTFNQFTLELSRTTVGRARPGPTLSRPPGGLGGRLERTIQPGRTRVPIGDCAPTRVNVLCTSESTVIARDNFGALQVRALIVFRYARPKERFGTERAGEIAKRDLTLRPART